MSAVRIRASWYPSTESGRLIDADANPAHIGGIVAMGTGRIDHTVIVDRPRRFVITTEAHAPFAFIVSPDMSEAVISEGSRIISRHTMPLLEASYHYPTPAEALERLPVTQKTFIPRRSALVAPSGFPSGRTVPTIPLNERARPSEAIRYYQRIMLGTGFGTGEQASDGILGTNTANAVQSWARWYNGLPEGPMASSLDLKRGAVVTVDRALTPEKQLAMQRFEARASDVLAQITSTNTTVVTPPAPPPPAPVVNVAPAGFPWLGAAGLTIAAATLFAFLKYANDNQKKQATARSAATRRGSR